MAQNLRLQYSNSNVQLLETAKALLSSLLKTAVNYKAQLSISGTIGVNIDNERAILLHFDDVVWKNDDLESRSVVSSESCDVSSGANVNNNNTVTSRQESVSAQKCVTAFSELSCDDVSLDHSATCSVDQPHCQTANDRQGQQRARDEELNVQSSGSALNKEIGQVQKCSESLVNSGPRDRSSEGDIKTSVLSSAFQRSKILQHLLQGRKAKLFRHRSKLQERIDSTKGVSDRVSDDPLTLEKWCQGGYAGGKVPSTFRPNRLDNSTRSHWEHARKQFQSGSGFRKLRHRIPVNDKLSPSGQDFFNVGRSSQERSIVAVRERMNVCQSDRPGSSNSSRTTRETYASNETDFNDGMESVPVLSSKSILRSCERTEHEIDNVGDYVDSFVNEWIKEEINANNAENNPFEEVVPEEGRSICPDEVRLSKADAAVKDRSILSKLLQRDKREKSSSSDMTFLGDLLMKTKTPATDALSDTNQLNNDAEKLEPELSPLGRSPSVKKKSSELLKLLTQGFASQQLNAVDGAAGCGNDLSSNNVNPTGEDPWTSSQGASQIILASVDSDLVDFQSESWNMSRSSSHSSVSPKQAASSFSSTFPEQSARHLSKADMFPASAAVASLFNRAAGGEKCVTPVSSTLSPVSSATSASAANLCFSSALRSLCSTSSRSDSSPSLRGSKVTAGGESEFKYSTLLHQLVNCRKDEAQGSCTSRAPDEPLVQRDSSASSKLLLKLLNNGASRKRVEPCDDAISSAAVSSKTSILAGLMSQQQQPVPSDSVKRRKVQIDASDSTRPAESNALDIAQSSASRFDVNLRQNYDPSIDLSSFVRNGPGLLDYGLYSGQEGSSYPGDNRDGTLLEMLLGTSGAGGGELRSRRSERSSGRHSPRASLQQQANSYPFDFNSYSNEQLFVRTEEEFDSDAVVKSEPTYDD